MMKMIKEVILWTILLLKKFLGTLIGPICNDFHRYCQDILKGFLQWNVCYWGHCASRISLGHEPDSKARKHKKDNHKLLAKISTFGLRNDTAQTGQSFAPRCEERPECGSTSVQSDCLCSGLQVVVMVVLMMTRMAILWYFSWASAIMPLWKRWYLIESSI